MDFNLILKSYTWHDRTITIGETFNTVAEKIIYAPGVVMSLILDHAKMILY